MGSSSGTTPITGSTTFAASPARGARGARGGGIFLYQRNRRRKFWLSPQAGALWVCVWPLSRWEEVPEARVSAELRAERLVGQELWCAYLERLVFRGR